MLLVDPCRRVAILLTLQSATACSEPRGAPPDDDTCVARTERATAAPGLQLDADRPTLESSAVTVCVSDASVRVGPRRVDFDPARAGDGLSLALSEALPKPGATGVVDLWAPADLSARNVALVASAFARAGVAVRLVAIKRDTAHLLARIDPPRPDTFPEPGAIPEEVDVWVEMSPTDLAVVRTDGGHVPVERDEEQPSARWTSLAESLRDQRLVAPNHRRLVFAPDGDVSYADWAHALEIAAQEGFDQIELTPLGALEALREEVGLELLRRQGGVHPLPEVERAPAVLPPDFADPASALGDRSTVEAGSIEVGGYLDEAEVERTIQAHLDELAVCHERAPAADASRETHALMAFAVDPSGRVRSVAAVPPLNPRATDRHIADRDPMSVCLRARISRWELSPSRSHQIAGVRLPLTFRAAARE